MNEMTELDNALVKLREEADDAERKCEYYDLFLNANFFVPIDEEGTEGDDVFPLVIEAEGNNYLMLFDTEERLFAWAAGKVPFVEVPGHLLAATTDPPLRWALNAGTPYSKSFLPEEIKWLKDVVEKCETDVEEKG